MDIGKPEMFIGSANHTNTKEIVKSIELSLKSFVNVMPWFSGFEPGSTTIESLVEKREKVDFACFILDSQDILMFKGEVMDAPRDNVVFEIGLFIGMLGQKRTFIVYPEGKTLKHPTDLNGVNMIPVHASAWESPKNLLELMEEPVSRIRDQVLKLENRKWGEIKHFIEALHTLIQDPQVERERLVLERFNSSILHLVRKAARVENKNFINLVRDICLYIESPFDIQDVTELADVQGSLVGQKEVWVFTSDMLDNDEPMFSTVKNNIGKGVKYVYFQNSPDDYNRLIKKLVREMGRRKDWEGAAICILVPETVLMPCDYLIYDPRSRNSEKGYVGKSTIASKHLLIQLNQDNVKETRKAWQKYVEECWEEYLQSQSGKHIFEFDKMN